ncbi:unnamed protein product [Calicophoron daubneyi]|uniref:mitogen-activated protein kinase kinase n=1 Tax=Calicophoron daubneyi TaxID=300641 RepID=A0AAV2TC28_CALDB
MSRPPGRNRRNPLNLTLPASIAQLGIDDSSPETKDYLTSDDHKPSPACGRSPRANNLSSPIVTDSRSSARLAGISENNGSVPIQSIIRTRGAQSGGANRHTRIVSPPTSSEAAAARGVNRHSNRYSTGPVDVAEVLRRLEAQDLDDNQRKRLSAFVTEKQKISELRPEDFEVLSELGKGNGGVVTQVRHIGTGLIMAKKNIHLEIKPMVRERIIRELQVLHDCNSPYIVGYYGAFFANGDISLCMEYMNGGSLDVVLKHAGRIPEPIVAKILYSVLKGLQYLRQALDIIHRDVKPSNILVKRNGEVKLCDFGVSGQLNDSLANSFVGTRSYMAPERLNGESYDILSDVWSLGLSLVELVTGRYPLPAIEDEKVYLKAFSPDREVNLAEHLEVAKHGRRLPPVTAQNERQMAIFELLSCIVDEPLPHLPRFGFSDDLIDLIDSCLRRVPSTRPALAALLKHPFVTTVAGACPSGNVCRQSQMCDGRMPDFDETGDPINLGNYLNAVLGPSPFVDGAGQ